MQLAWCQSYDEHVRSVTLPHLLACLCIHEQPSNFNDLGRVLCHIYTMLVTGCSNVDDQVAVQVVGRLCVLIRGHCVYSVRPQGFKRVTGWWIDVVMVVRPSNKRAGGANGDSSSKQRG